MKLPDEASIPGHHAFGQFLLGLLKKRWRGYRRELKRCRRKCSEQAVHQLRVSIRRLLSLLDLLARIVEIKHLRFAENILKKNLKAFARLRDTHTQLLCIEKLRRDFPEARAYHRALERRGRRLVKRIRRKLGRAQQGRLRDFIAAIKKQLRALAGDPAREKKKFAGALDALRAAYAGVVKCYRAIRPADTGSFHRTRIAFKKFRYMMESLQPLLPDVTERRLEAMRRYQTRLGNIQDWEVLLASLKRFAEKRELKPQKWKALSRAIRRRLADRIKQFMASRAELFHFCSLRNP